MSEISLETVTGKLNRLGYDAFMRALRHAKKRGHAMSSWRTGCCTSCPNDRSDVSLALDHYKIDRARAAEGRRPTSSTASARTRPRCLASRTQITDVLDRGWHYATLFFGETQIRTGHLLVAALKSRELRRALTASRSSSPRRRRHAVADDRARCGRSPTRRTCGRWTARACARAATPAPTAAEGAARQHRARSLLDRHDRQGRRPARWTRSSAATRRSARSSTC